jgi:hypothetical protein
MFILHPQQTLVELSESVVSRRKGGREHDSTSRVHIAGFSIPEKAE